MRNDSVLNSLKQVPRNIVYAELTDLQNRSVYKFLYNPEDYTYSREANYKAAQTALSDSQTQQYFSTNSSELVFNNLLLDGYANGRSVLKLLEDLDKLLSPDPRDKSGIPKKIFFKWGAYKSKESVLVSLKYTPTLWLNGEPAQARVDIRLLETSVDKLKTATVSQQEAASIAASTEAIAAANTTLPATSQSPIPITQILNARQQAEAREASIRYVSQNASSLPSEVRRLTGSGNISYRVDRNGAVYILNRQTNQVVHRLGIYNIRTRQIDVAR